jgi:hypothetical protein
METRYQALADDGDERAYVASGENTRMVPKALPLPRTRVCAKATHVAKATAARRAGRWGSVQGGAEPKARPCLPNSVRACAGARAHGCA